MRRVWWCWFLGVCLVLGLAGCPAPSPTPPWPPGPPPTPIPTPVPPTPTPTPTPVPVPTPPGMRVLSLAEYDRVVLNVTSEVEITQWFGPFLERNPVGLPGGYALLYFAANPLGGENLIAEFWIRNGGVVNKNRL